MNARRRTMVHNPPKKVKNSGSTPGTTNQVKPVKNSVGKPNAGAGYAVPRNSVSCNDY